MPDPVLMVEHVPAFRGAAKKYPLATLSGVMMLQELLIAGEVWSRCTKPQRTLLSEMCPPVAEQLLEQGRLAADQMPSIPDSVRSASRAALQRRGLVDDAGRLTGKAVHTWYYAGRIAANGGDHA